MPSSASESEASPESVEAAAFLVLPDLIFCAAKCIATPKKADEKITRTTLTLKK